MVLCISLIPNDIKNILLDNDLVLTININYKKIIFDRSHSLKNIIMNENAKTSTSPIEGAEIIDVLSPEKEAQKLTKRFVLWSMGGSLIPVTFLDIAAVIGAQIQLINKMSKIYDVPFQENRIKSIIGSLIGSLGLVPSGAILFGSLVKFIPGIGSLISAASLPIVVGGITYATGKVFIAHFESGGDLLDFNPEKAKKIYKKFFKEGQDVAKDLKEETKTEPEPKKTRTSRSTEKKA